MEFDGKQLFWIYFIIPSLPLIILNLQHKINILLREFNINELIEGKISNF